jgi:hypothetical protein
VASTTKAHEVSPKVSRLRRRKIAWSGTGVVSRSRFSVSRKKIVEPVTTALRMPITRMSTKNASRA